MSIELEEVRRLQLKPGDTLVLRSAHSLGAEMVEYLTAAMKEAFPDHRTVVLDSELSLEVVEAADSAS